MKSLIWMPCVLVLAGCSCGDGNLAETPKTIGWEAGASYCDQRVFDPTGIVWRADVDKVMLSRREGAEGFLTVSNGQFIVEKTNDKGFLVITCEPFACETNLVVAHEFKLHIIRYVFVR